jgi:nicotinamide-nucleotide amidase
MEALAKKVGERLKAARAKLVTAESCTGGWAAQVVTSVAGSSAWFERGFVTYSNEAKRELLGVEEKTLEAHGAVSEETAREMAQGALSRGKGSVALAVTGVAGPGGGTALKPVGLVYLHVSAPGAERGQELHLHGDRSQVRELAAVAALQLVRMTVS